MNSESAKNGFKTFILTLSISLIVFSVIYYVASSSSTDSMEAELSSAEEATAYNYKTVEGDSDSVFGKYQDEGAVLALTDDLLEDNSATTTDTTDTTTETTEVTEVAEVVETTESAPTPDDGIVSVTFGLFAAFILFLVSVVLISKNPRNLALQSFERSFRD